MANASVQHETTYRVLVCEAGSWRVAAGGFTGLLGASQWLLDVFGETPQRSVRVERSSHDADFPGWVCCYSYERPAS